VWGQPRLGSCTPVEIAAFEIQMSAWARSKRCRSSRKPSGPAAGVRDGPSRGASPNNEINAHGSVLAGTAISPPNPRIHSPTETTVLFGRYLAPALFVATRSPLAQSTTVPRVERRACETRRHHGEELRARARIESAPISRRATPDRHVGAQWHGGVEHLNATISAAVGAAPHPQAHRS